jgi:hypothetical protein
LSQELENFKDIVEKKHVNCSFFLLIIAIFTLASSFDASGANVGNHCTEEFVKALQEIVPSPSGEKVTAQDILTKIKINSAEFTKNISGLPKEEVVSLLRSDPGVQWIAKDIREDKIQIAMNRREASREGIAKSGFLNQFETGRSGAEFSPAQREKVESFFAGVDAEEYKKLDVSERPKYGYVAPPLGSKIKLNREVQGYGPDIYYF